METPLHVVCGHCDSVVRLPRERLGQAPRCPSCHSELFQGQTLSLTTANFDKHIGRNDLPVVVDFWAPWCGPCRMMAPFYEQAANQMDTQVRFAKLNTEDEAAVAGRFRISSIPTLILFRGGAEVLRHSGAMNLGMLTDWLNSALR